MNITKVIQRLRETMPENVWGGRIAGSAEFLDALTDEARLTFPSMYVLLGSSNATTLSNTTFLQDYEENLLVIVVLDNRCDRRGQTAQGQIHDIQSALWAALLNWRLNPKATSLQYVDNEFLQMDKARYFHQFQFKQTQRLDAMDGVSLELDNFDKFFVDWELAGADPSTFPNAQDEIIDIYEE